jgi:hypothetical protein
MIRIVTENILLFLLPTTLYVGYMLLTRGMPEKGNLVDNTSLIWLSVAGALLVVTVLILFGSTSGGRPGQHYEPPSLKDGHIEPGRIE